MGASMRPGHSYPGKLCCRGRVDKHFGCFNEAGAFLPRKTVALRNDGSFYKELASMRPGHSYPGKQ